MFRVTDVIQLKPKEDVRAILRCHGMTLFPHLLLAGLFLSLPFFFLFYLTKYGALGMTAFGVSIAAGLLLALRAFHVWDSDVLVVTSHRVVDVDQRGIWHRVVSEAPMHLVEDVRWERRGAGETLLRLGTVLIRTGGSVPVIAAPKLARPELVQTLIHDLRDEARRTSASDDGANSGDRSRRMRVQKMLETVDDRTLDAIATVLQEKQEERIAQNRI